MKSIQMPLSIFSLEFTMKYLCTPHAVSLQIATLAQSTLSPKAAGDASQTTLVQIMYVFLLCCSTQIAHMEF